MTKDWYERRNRRDAPAHKGVEDAREPGQDNNDTEQTRDHSAQELDDDAGSLKKYLAGR